MRIYPQDSLNPFIKGDFMYSLFKLFGDKFSFVFFPLYLLSSLPLSLPLFPQRKCQCFSKSFIVEKIFYGKLW